MTDREETIEEIKTLLGELQDLQNDQETTEEIEECKALAEKIVRAQGGTPQTNRKQSDGSTWDIVDQNQD